MQIAKYLEKIHSNKTINFDHFCKQLNAHGYDNQTLLQIFAVEKQAKSAYVVRVLDTQQFAQLRAAFPEHKITDRISAAVAGDSHKHPVSQAMIILWPDQHNHPVVVLNDHMNITVQVSLAQRLLIIENQENFVQKQRTIGFLKQQFPGFNDEGLDIAHGAGNAISNGLNRAFFNHYQHIDCLLDLDVGGLTTFVNLCELTDHPRLHFLVPPCAAELLTRSKLHLQDKHLPQLRRLKARYPQLQTAIELIASQQKMLEQEMYLQD